MFPILSESFYYKFIASILLISSFFRIISGRISPITLLHLLKFSLTRNLPFGGNLELYTGLAVGILGKERYKLKAGLLHTRRFCRADRYQLLIRVVFFFDNRIIPEAVVVSDWFRPHYIPPLRHSCNQL